MDEVETLLDWSGVTQTSFDEQGFYSAIFHPQFANPTDPKRFLFICYTHQLVEGANTSGEFADSYWRLTRVEFDADGTVIPDSETVLISLYDPQQWHNGGAMFFGDDGFLYLSNGDGGDHDGSYGTSQELDGSLFACIIRIDVDEQGGEISHPIRRQPTEIVELPDGIKASYTQNYYIPSDNPWVNDPGPGDTESPAMEELYAIGLRSPHSMQYDLQSKQVWIGDVGQLSREELNMFLLDSTDPRGPNEGLNFGWNIQEGFTGPDLPEDAPGIETRPIHDYDRSVGICIIGGFIYRGSHFEEQLGGKALFGDNRVAKLWSLEYEEGEAPIVNELTRLSDGGILNGGDVLGLTNICQDKNGEILLLYSAGAKSPKGKLYTLEYIGTTEDPPTLLSQTGAFTDLETLTPAPALLPYTVNSPLWSDNAEKLRWIALPNDGLHDTPAEQIEFYEAANWVFPAGTVLVKHFDLPLDLGNPKITRRLETRFIVCLPYGRKYGVTYRWNDAQTEATLLEQGETGTYEVIQSNGAALQQTWQFPSRSDCISCHNDASGQALGVRTHQLHTPSSFGGDSSKSNQLTIWNNLKMFNHALSESLIENTLRSAGLEDETYPLEHRVRSYLDSNCAHCHQPGGSGPGFDARLTTPLNAQQLINSPLRPDLEGRFDLIADSDEDAQIVPGKTSLSAVHFRLAHSQPDSAAMPPLAKSLVDEAAVKAVADWIQSLNPSEFEYPDSFPIARYARITGLTELNDRDSMAVSDLSILDELGDKIPHTELRIAAVSSEETHDQLAPATFAIDNDPNSFWTTEWGTDKELYPHWISIDLGRPREVSGFALLPRTDPPTAVIETWKFELSEDGLFWRSIDGGSFTYPDGVVEQRIGPIRTIRPIRPLLGTPNSADPHENGEVTISIILNHPVAELPTGALDVENGEIISISGSGYSYSAKVRARTNAISAHIPANSLSTFGTSNLSSDRISIEVNGEIPNDWERWIDQHHLPKNWQPLDSDDDRDTLKLIIEYAFNLDPLKTEWVTYDSDAAPGPYGPAGIPSIQYLKLPDGTHKLQTEFIRRTVYANDPQLNYQVQFSTDLTNWEGIPKTHPNVSTQTLENGWERVVVEDTKLSTPEIPRFGRVVISIPES